MASFIKIPPEVKSVIVKFASEADENTLSPLAAKIGISPSALYGIVKILPVIADDNFDLQSVLPKLLPVVLNYFISGGGKKSESSSAPIDTLSDKEDKYAVTYNGNSDEWSALIQSDLY